MIMMMLMIVFKRSKWIVKICVIYAYGENECVRGEKVNGANSVTGKHQRFDFGRDKLLFSLLI